MKKVILLALLMPAMAFGQVVDKFESGVLLNWSESTPGHWSADTSSSISGKYSLHHTFDNPDAGWDCIASSIRDIHPSEGDTHWSFLLRYGYDPSSQNNWAVFLLSDCGPVAMTPDLGVKGYAVGVNLTGSDDSLRLWKVNGKNIVPVINSGINWQLDIGPSKPVNISVERSRAGAWSMTVSDLSAKVLSSKTGTDLELFGQQWFGILYRYSSTRDRLLWIDDVSVEGVFHSDNTPPAVVKCEAAGKNIVEITLDEEPVPDFMDTGIFSLIKKNSNLSR